MDVLSPEQRSENMRRIRGKDTGPELIVRKLCRDIGFHGYRLHRNDLPGKPDIVWVGKKKAVFVNGCFWHGHKCKKGSHVPSSNSGFWVEKIARNRFRDAKNIRALRTLGWNVLIIWECELKDLGKTRNRLKSFMCPLGQ